MRRCPSSDLYTLSQCKVVGSQSACEIGADDVVGRILVEDEHLWRWSENYISTGTIMNSHSSIAHPKILRLLSKSLSLVERSAATLARH